MVASRIGSFKSSIYDWDNFYGSFLQSAPSFDGRETLTASSHDNINAPTYEDDFISFAMRVTPDDIKNGISVLPDFYRLNIPNSPPLNPEAYLSATLVRVGDRVDSKG